jgi:hypothetical protein
MRKDRGNIMERFFRETRKALGSRKIIKQLYLLTLVSAILLAAVLVKNTNGTQYVVDNNGNVVELRRKTAGMTGEYELRLHTDGTAGKTSRDVKIMQKAAAGEKRPKKKDAAREAEKRLEAEINMAVTEIEDSKSTRTVLPKKLPDGTKLTWEKKGSGRSRTWIAIPVMYVAIAFMLIRKDADAERARSAAAGRSILRSLPRFSNQLLLMLNCGMILSDSFDTIAAGYRMIPDDEKGIFEKELIGMMETYRMTDASAASLFTELAGKYSVKELMRIATILSENEKRGSDIIENLERESGYLWEARKTTAKERGKAMDTKLAYPLGMLLVVLIVITMAPAMLTM